MKPEQEADFREFVIDSRHRLVSTAYVLTGEYKGVYVQLPVRIDSAEASRVEGVDDWDTDAGSPMYEAVFAAPGSQVTVSFHGNLSPISATVGSSGVVEVKAFDPNTVNGPFPVIDSISVKRPDGSTGHIPVAAKTVAGETAARNLLPSSTSCPASTK